MGSEELANEDLIFDAEDRSYRDFTFGSYEVPHKPEGALQSATVLRYALRGAGLTDAIWPLINEFRASCGPDPLIWGAKWTAGQLSGVELYLHSSGESRSFSAIRKRFHPWLERVGQFDESCGYSMSSFDLFAFRGDRIDRVHIYVPGDNSDECRDGFSYELTDGGPLAKNYYKRFLAATEFGAIEDAIALSPSCAIAAMYDDVLAPFSSRCTSIILATKPGADGIYLSRLDLSSVVEFGRLYFPAEVVGVLEANSVRFGHLLWDVGVDFSRRVSGGSAPEIEKSCLFGFC